MAGYFIQQDIDKLYASRRDMHRTSADLREHFLVRSFASERGREFAYHGFCRRLSYMVRAVDAVYERLPPDIEIIPERQSVVDATIAIHSFVLNAFGCLDNLAWIWVCEKPVLDSKGIELSPLRVGLGPKCGDVRASFSAEFIEYLNSRQEWVEHLKGFRDSLAHRIPLYIPPFIVTPDAIEQYNKLEADSSEALHDRNFDKYYELQSAQKALAIWRPWMTHSVVEKAPKVVFHVQLIQDYMAIEEFGRQMLRELERHAL